MITLSFHRHYKVFSKGKILTCFHFLVYVTIDLSLTHWISGDNVYVILILYTIHRLFYIFLSDALIKCFLLGVCFIWCSYKVLLIESMHVQSSTFLFMFSYLHIYIQIKFLLTAILGMYGRLIFSSFKRDVSK